MRGSGTRTTSGTGRRRRLLRLALIGTLGIASTALYAQLAFRELQNMESQYNPLPVDWNVPGEFVVGRLMYPPRAGGGFRSSGDWTQGGTSWTVDYPRGDRVFAELLERLTVADVRSVEQPVNLDDGDDVFHWPFLIVGMPGTWDLTEAQAAKLREYLLRGGFLLADSFFGTEEWAGFEVSLKRVFPNRPVVELPNDHAIFNVVYEFDELKQVRNWRTLPRGYRGDGIEPHWRAILDDDGRIMVAMSFNNDLGDSWQESDNPTYPQEDSYRGIRHGVNYVIYTMTH